MKVLPLFALCAFAIGACRIRTGLWRIDPAQPARGSQNRRGRSVSRRHTEFALRHAAAERCAGGQRHVSGAARLPLRPVADVSAQPARDSRRHAGYSFQPQSQCGDLLHDRWLDADGVVNAIPRSYRRQRADAHPGIRQEPGKAPSPIVAASYTVSGAATPLPVNADVSGSTVTKGTMLRMQTGNRVSSETANAGDHFYLLLDENLVVNGNVLAPRGMSVEAVITSVQHAGQNGRSGVITLPSDRPQRAWSHDSAERIIHAGRSRYRFAIESHLGHQHGARGRSSASRQRSKDRAGYDAHRVGCIRCGDETLARSGLRRAVYARLGDNLVWLFLYHVLIKQHRDEHRGWNGNDGTENSAKLRTNQQCDQD